MDFTNCEWFLGFILYSSNHLLYELLELAPETLQTAVFDMVLKSRNQRFTDLQVYYGASSDVSRKLLESGRVTMPTSGKTVVLGREKIEFLIRFVEYCNIDELKAAELLEDYLYRDHRIVPDEATERSHILRSPDFMVNMITYFFSEKVMLLQCVCSLLRICEDANHRFYRLANLYIDRLIHETNILNRLLHQYRQSHGEKVPRSVIKHSQLSGIFVKGILLQQKSLLEATFLLVYSKMKLNFESMNMIFDVLMDTEFGHDQPNTFLIDITCLSIRRKVSDLCALIALEVLNLEDLVEATSHPISANKNSILEDAQILGAINRAIVRLGTRAEHSLAMLGWSGLLSRFSELAFEGRIKGSRKVLEMLSKEIENACRLNWKIDPTEFSRWKTTDMEASQILTTVSYRLRPFEKVKDILGSELCSSDDPNSIGYKSVLKGLIMMFVSGYELMQLPNSLEIVAIFGQIITNQSLLALQYWEHDFPFPERRALLNVVASLFPHEYLPFFELLKSLMPDGRCQLYCFQFLSRMVSFTCLVPQKSDFIDYLGDRRARLTREITAKSLSFPHSELYLPAYAEGLVIRSLEQNDLVKWNVRYSVWQFLGDFISRQTGLIKEFDNDIYQTCIRILELFVCVMIDNEAISNDLLDSLDAESFISSCFNLFRVGRPTIDLHAVSTIFRLARSVGSNQADTLFELLNTPNWSPSGVVSAPFSAPNLQNVEFLKRVCIEAAKVTDFEPIAEYILMIKKLLLFLGMQRSPQRFEVTRHHIQFVACDVLAYVHSIWTVNLSGEFMFNLFEVFRISIEIEPELLWYMTKTASHIEGGPLVRAFDYIGKLLCACIVTEREFRFESKISCAQKAQRSVKAGCSSLISLLTQLIATNHPTLCELVLSITQPKISDTLMDNLDQVDSFFLPESFTLLTMYIKLSKLVPCESASRFLESLQLNAQKISNLCVRNLSRLDRINYWSIIIDFLGASLGLSHKLLVTIIEGKPEFYDILLSCMIHIFNPSGECTPLEKIQCLDFLIEIWESEGPLLPFRNYLGKSTTIWTSLRSYLEIQVFSKQSFSKDDLKTTCDILIRIARLISNNLIWIRNQASRPDLGSNHIDIRPEFIQLFTIFFEGKNLPSALELLSKVSISSEEHQLNPFLDCLQSLSEFLSTAFIVAIDATHIALNRKSIKVSDFFSKLREWTRGVFDDPKLPDHALLSFEMCFLNLLHLEQLYFERYQGSLSTPYEWQTLLIGIENLLSAPIPLPVAEFELIPLLFVSVVKQLSKREFNDSLVRESMLQVMNKMSHLIQPWTRGTYRKGLSKLLRLTMGSLSEIISLTSRSSNPSFASLLLNIDLLDDLLNYVLHEYQNMNSTDMYECIVDFAHLLISLSSLDDVVATITDRGLISKFCDNPVVTSARNDIVKRYANGRERSLAQLAWCMCLNTVSVFGLYRPKIPLKSQNPAWYLISLCQERIVMTFKETVESAEIDLVLIDELCSISNLLVTLNHDSSSRLPFNNQLSILKQFVDLIIQKITFCLLYPARLEKFVPLRPREERELNSKQLIYQGNLIDFPKSNGINFLSTMFSLTFPGQSYPLSVVSIRFLDLLHNLIVFSMKFEFMSLLSLSSSSGSPNGLYTLNDVQNAMQELQTSLELYMHLQESISRILEFSRSKVNDERACGLKFALRHLKLVGKLFIYCFSIYNSISRCASISESTKFDALISLKNSLSMGLKSAMRNLKGFDESTQVILEDEFHQFQNHLERLTSKLGQTTESPAIRSFPSVQLR